MVEFTRAVVAGQTLPNHPRRSAIAPVCAPELEITSHGSQRRLTPAADGRKRKLRQPPEQFRRRQCPLRQPATEPQSLPPCLQHQPVSASPPCIELQLTCSGPVSCPRSKWPRTRHENPPPAGRPSLTLHRSSPGPWAKASPRAFRPLPTAAPDPTPSRASPTSTRNSRPPSKTRVAPCRTMRT